MSIFDLLKNILHNKVTINLDVDDYSQFSPFIINRWLSFASKNAAAIINCTVNRFGSIFDDRLTYFNFLKNILPKTQNNFFNYVKKPKQDVDLEHEDKITLIAKNLELSKREIRQYLKY